METTACIGTSVCIGNHSDDIFYRYKMPKISFKIEKTKIAITNLHEIADAIGTPLDILVNFIKSKIGTSLKEREKDFIVTDTINLIDIENSIKIYIDYFVICYTCKTPEVWIIRKKFRMKCKACGAKNNITVNNDTEKTFRYCSK
jgi:translation initiation factor 2 subunit 2